MHLEVDIGGTTVTNKQVWRPVQMGLALIGMVRYRDGYHYAMYAEMGQFRESAQRTEDDAIRLLVIKHRDRQGLCRYCGEPAIKTFYHCIECWITEFEVIPEQAELIRAGAIPHSCNCLECRKLNRIYCPKCCD